MNNRQQRAASRRPDRPVVPGGWGIPAADPQRHYFLDLDQRSLCGRFDADGVELLMPEVPDVPGEHDHDACRARYAELAAALVSERGIQP